MKTGMILQNSMPPPDIRVEKEASTLIGEGHEVHLLVERNPGEKREETVKGMKLMRGVEVGPLRDKIHRYSFSFTFRDIHWRRAIRSLISERGVDLLHVHDLPLVGEAVRAAREAGIPVIADLHENYPAGLQVWYTSWLKKKTIYNYNRWRDYEYNVLKEVDAVIVVIEESARRLEGIGVPADKIHVVPNTASFDRDEIALDPVIVNRYRDDFMISYVGGFAPHRGLDVVVKALPLAAEEIPSLKLVLVGGRNPAYRDYLEKLALELGCRDIVEMTGWVNFEKIWSYIEASDICLVPHSRNPHTDTTIPHKIFQYMMRGKPVIVSDCPPLKRVIEESRAGLWFRYDSPEELAGQIVKLYRDNQQRESLARNGLRAFREKFNWDMTSGELRELYASIL
ncbi:MAG: glycosyltransferase [Candidatus Latescibacteria bacterium]|nr:glycosyltransferase [bacterium]MBD3424381.1 glycosyltransferase [Candidatus Latescibacterota bacterium]